MNFARVTNIIDRGSEIETRAGLENAEESVRVDGIDAPFVGPADLFGTLGVFAEWNADEFDDAMESIIDAGNSVGVPIGTLTVDIDDV